MNTRKIKPLVLPIAIVLGLLLHQVCNILTPIVPYIIFTILILTFSTTDLRRLKFTRLDFWLMAFQTCVTFGLYFGLRALTANGTLAEGLMLGALCPVASSVTVVACMLGAKKENTVGYTIAGNLLVCVLAPVVFAIIGEQPGITFGSAFLPIFLKIATVIGLPFFVMLAVQLWLRPVNDFLSRWNGLSFYLWALALLLTLGQTIDFIFIHHEGNGAVILGLGIGSAIICPLQFYIGRFIGRRYGDAVGGQQLLGQKNSAMGIWMSNTYLNPLASTFLAFYSIWQNVLNSWQIWRHQRKE